MYQLGLGSCVAGSSVTSIAAIHSERLLFDLRKISWEMQEVYRRKKRIVLPQHICLLPIVETYRVLEFIQWGFCRAWKLFLRPLEEIVSPQQVLILGRYIQICCAVTLSVPMGEMDPHLIISSQTIILLAFSYRSWSLTRPPAHMAVDCVQIINKPQGSGPLLSFRRLSRVQIKAFHGEFNSGCYARI